MPWSRPCKGAWMRSGAFAWAMLRLGAPYPWSPDQMIAAIRLLGHEPAPLKD